MTIGILLILPFVFQTLAVNKDIPVFQGHGEADHLIPCYWGAMTAAILMRRTSKYTFKTYPDMMHSACPEVGMF